MMVIPQLGPQIDTDSDRQRLAYDRASSLQGSRGIDLILLWRPCPLLLRTPCLEPPARKLRSH